MNRFLTRNELQVKDWMKTHPEAAKLPIYFDGKEIVWLNRKMRKKKMKKVKFK